MTDARKLVVSENEGIYHCISRCVRRAYLCGLDSLSGKNFNHRKAWVKDRLEFLSTVFVLDVLGYALMSNHQHTLLRTRPDIQNRLNSREVARRWLTLYPPSGVRGSLPGATEKQISALARNTERINVLRKRLGSVSWFMKSLNEYLARRANAEDKCKGRFWEGRFKCHRVYGEAAVLSCAVYIDLNLIRAGVAKTPETSTFTSAWERIGTYRRAKSPNDEPPLWLSPIKDTKYRRGFLSIDLPAYLEILDATGRELRAGKRGSIPAHIAPILSRLGIKPDNWLHTVQTLGRSYSIAIADTPTLRERAADLGKRWLKGLSAAKLAFR